MSKKPFNPLFDSKANTEVLANYEKSFVIESSVPVSPITGKEMIPALCGDIPVFVDLDTRVVLPTKE